MYGLNENVAPLATQQPKNFWGRARSFVNRHSGTVKTAVGAAITAGAATLAHAQTDATVIATNASTAFDTVAPITITIVGFYVIIKIAKRVVK